MLSCIPTRRGRGRDHDRGRRSLGRESLCERLRRRLAPASRCRPLWERHCSLSDTPGTVASGLPSRETSGYLADISSSQSSKGNIKPEVPVRVSPGQENPRNSGQDSPHPGTQPPEMLTGLRCETPVTATGPRATLKDPVSIHTGLTDAGDYFPGGREEIRVLSSGRLLRPRFLPEPSLPNFLNGEPYFGPIFPNTSVTLTSPQQALKLGERVTTPPLGTSSPLPACWDDFRQVGCLNSEQLFIPKAVRQEGDPWTTSPWQSEDSTAPPGLKKESQLSIHTLPCATEQPEVAGPGAASIQHGAASIGEELSYGAGHSFRAKRFIRRVPCAVCKDLAGGFGRRAYICTHCRMLVHKRCRTLLTIQCGQCCSFPSQPVMPGNPPPRVSEQAHAGSSCHPPSVHGLEQGTKHIEFTNAQENDQASPALALEDFHLLRVIGKGSYSKIMLVQLRNTEKTFAMKVVKKGRVHSHRAETERRVLQQVGHHPFLVGLHAYLETQSRIMLVLDYVSGGDIMFHLQRKRAFPEAQAQFYCGEIALAVNHLHQQGILCRNLKLDNILLDPQGHIRITDFCVSKEGMGPRDLTSTFCGTVNYLAPEIIRGEVYGFPVDWWALGVIAFEMMVGESPFVVAELPEASEAKSISHLLRLIVESNISIPAWLSLEAAGILYAFLNKDPKQRLGCRPPNGLPDIQKHPFFREVDWARMERKQVPPPFPPSISADLGLHNFDCVFTQEPVQLTPDENGSIIEGSEVSHSEYVSCPSMDEEECWDHFPKVPPT